MDGTGEGAVKAGRWSLRRRRERRGPNWLMEEAGLGRAHNLVRDLLTVVAVVSAAAGWGLYAQVRGQIAERTERYVTVLGPDQRLIGSYRAGVETAVPDGYYVQAARDWLLDVRERPTGASIPGSLAQRNVLKSRDRALAMTGDALGPSLKTNYWDPADTIFAGNNAVTITELTANIATGPDGAPWRDQRGALVHLTWWETIEGSPGAKRYSALVTFLDQHGDRAMDTRNPMGVWVTDFRPTIVEVRRGAS